MVRETRHLWIGNLPENVREEQIRDLFQRHGRVQSVKFLPDDGTSAVPGIAGSSAGRTGKSATVAFIDIRSAAKALRAVHSMAGQPLQITYHEPGSVPSRTLHVAEHSSPGDSIPSTPTTNDCGTNSVPAILPGNSISSVTASGITNGPTASATGSGLYRQRFPLQHGQSEDSSSHFYEQPKSFSRGRGDGHGFHGGRGRREHRHLYHSNRLTFPTDRNYRVPWGYPNETRYAPSAHSEGDERTAGPPSSSHPQQIEASSKATRRPDSPASSVSSRHLHSKRHKSRSVSESGSSDRGSSGGSRSRSGSRSSVSTSVSSARSRSPPHHNSTGHYSSSRGGSPGSRFHQNSYNSRRRCSRSRLVSSRLNDSTRVRHSSRSPLMPASPTSSESSSPSPHRKILATPHSPSHSPSSAKSYSPSRSINQSGHHHHHHHNHHHHQRRQLNSSELQSAIRIRNLPTRSTDTSLKDGLYHEYKKHGKVSWVRVIGTGSERYAIVCFKSSEHANRAVESSQDKQFFGCKIQVSRFYNSRGDEAIGLNDEDSRGLSEDEFSPVSNTTRTVLITGLDTNIDYKELKAELGQCGDIVTLDIRTQGASTVAVCEFVDIASAIRAQWVRHVCKSREAITRVNFVRTSPSASILLDGTEGFNEKLITARCGQYGAITRVTTDVERNLTLVQFEEISCAQTAVREIRSWSMKGKHIHVDFTSPDCIRLFLERITANSRGVMPDSLPNSHRTLPASCYTDAAIGKDPNRRRRTINDIEFDPSKPMTHLRLLDESGSPESASSCHLREGKNNSGLLSGDDENNGRIYRRPDAYSSSLSPDTDRVGMADDAFVDTRGGKSEHCKIDPNCHENDSAVVTSSSDVINLDADSHENYDRALVNGNGKHNKFEFSRINSTASKSTIVAVAVDGVSSTSPEPKVEAVRKASPDPGVGLPMLETGGKMVDSHIITTGLADPRKKPNESKIRRSSADSGSNTTSSTLYTNGSEGGEESDDRPGTPLCDENPENFFANDNNNVSVKVPLRHMSNLTKPDQPLSLPLPGFAHRYPHYSSGNQNSRHNIVSAVSSKDTKVSLRRASETIIMKSPIKSPQYEGIGSVMNSSASDCETISPNPYSELKSCTINRLNDAFSLPSSKSTNTDSWHESDVAELNSSSVPLEGLEEPVTNYLNVRCVSVNSVDEIGSPCTGIVENSYDKECTAADSIPGGEKNIGAASSSDSESGSSPRRSPTEKSLDERLSLFYDQYNQWEGNRSSARAAPLHRSNVPSVEGVPRSVVPNSVPSTPVGSDCPEPTSLTRFPRTKHKVLDLDEMRHQPSDIVKSLLAKKSVFDEDTKRLENFGEKYEAKCAPIAANWRSLAKPPNSPAPVSYNSVNSVMSPTSKPSSPPTQHVSVFQSPTTTTPHTSANRIIHHNTNSQIPNTKLHQQQPPSGVVKPTVKDLNYNNSCSGIWQTLNNRAAEKSVPSAAPLKMSGSSSQGQQKALIELAIKTIPTIPTSSMPSTNFNKSLQEIQPPPVSTIVLSRSNATSKNASMLCANLSPSGSENTISQSVVHPNIPRIMERSVSLDSKRMSANASIVSSSAGCSPTSVSNSSPVSTTPVATNHLSHRRISADSHGLAAVSKDTLTVKKMEPSFPEVSKKCIKETSTALTKDHLAKVVQAKDDLSSKGVGLIKTEPSVVQHPSHPPETTVAVVASLQSPVVLPKDSKRDSRDKKRRNSGSSTPTMPNPSASMTSSSSRSEIPSIVTPKPCTSSSRERKDKDKDKDIKRVTNEEPVSGINCNTGHHGNISNHHHGKSKPKDKIKEEKEHHNTESNSSITTSSTKDSHSHRKDKEKDKEFNKLKRRLSSQESEQAADSKKSKVEKKDVTAASKESNSEQPHSNHNSGKSKYSSSTSIERRESRDSSSSTKEKPKENKEKSERDSGKLAEAGSSSSKDHHHKAKLSSSSSSSSSTSKHHHGSEKKTSNENHTSSSHAHKSSSDNFKKKEKSSSKETSKPKHSSGSSHSHSHHGSASSTGIKKEASSKARSSSWKDKESKSKDKTFDSDDDHDSILPTPTSVEKDKGREKSKDRGEKHEKREDSVKRDRHKSGDSSSAPNSADTKRMRTKQEKKKRRNRIIVDETESSDSGKSGDEDDDDKQKHHSIFEVVIDEYPSMYDKVKARSNRACKNATAQQQKEEQRKQEKLKEQFQQLKQSRAKREEKKRSTSIEERKSYVNSSSEDSDAPHRIDSDNESGNYIKLDRERERHHSRVQETGDEPTSDEEEARNHKVGNPAKLPEKVRKSKSRSSKTNQSTKHRGKKSLKSSPPCTSSFASTSSIFYSHSDEDSRNSSPPAIKKRKIKHQTVGINAGSSMSHQSIDTKSSDDSASDFDDSNVIISNVTLPSLPPKKYGSSSSSSKLKKLRMVEIYTDSDSSVRSNRNMRNSTTPSKSKTSREKIGTKQKSVDLKKLFDDTSETSGDEESNGQTAARKEKELKDKDEASKRSKDKEREPKDPVCRKKSLSSSGTSIRSYNKGQRRRLSSEDTNLNDTHHSVTKSDHSATMKDILFGSTSGSDAEEKPIVDERPKTPTPMIIPPLHSKPVYDETPVSSKSKSKTSRKQRSIIHLQAIASSHENSGSYEDDSMDAGTPITPVISSSSGKSEKKKRRHHKDKKSKRTESQETAVTSSVHTTTVGASDPIKIKTETVDVDSLFNSPQSSPRDIRPTQGMMSVGKTADTCRLAVDVTSSIFGTTTGQRSPILDVIKHLPTVKDFDDSASKSMFSFSTDEDEDELKIDISAVIKASDEQPDESEIDVEKDVDREQTLMAEEEEKKMHCLFEQDKAIESIVLLDRRTPPPVVNEEDVNPKDEIPKDEVAISQEETEDAVADLLETLGGDDAKSEDEEQSLVDKSLPPTIRILAEMAPPTDDLDVTREPPMLDDIKPEGWYDTKSPKDLLIDEGVITRECEIETPNDDNRLLATKLPSDISASPIISHTKPKTPEIITDQGKPFTSPECLVEGVNDGKLMKDIHAEVKETSGEERIPSTASTDVYEFTDSDDEKSEETHPLAHCKSTITVAPVKSPNVAAAISEPVDSAHKPPVSDTPGFLIKAEAPVIPAVPPVTAGIVLTLSSIIGTSPSHPGVINSSPATEDSRAVIQPIIPAVSVSATNTSNGSVGKNIPVVTPVRTTVDDTIDEVIRMAQNNTLGDVVPRTTTANRSRSRSHSKDTVEEAAGSHASIPNTPLGSVNKVGSGLTIEPSPRRGDLSLFPPSAGIPPPAASTCDQTAPRRETEKDPDAIQENLVDPQTGILTPMLRHSGEYVPVKHSAVEGPSLNMLSHHLQVPFRTTENINKAMESRQSVLEHMPQAHQQQVTQSKVEGLPAILAQQQHHGGPQKTPVIQQQQSPQMQHSRSPNLNTQPIGQYQKGVISHGTLPKAAIIYTSPGSFPTSKTGFNPNVPVSSMPQSSSPGSSLGIYTGKTTISQSSVPLSKSNFGAHQQSNSTSPSASYVTLVRPVEHMPPSIQQRPIQSGTPRTNQSFQTQLVRIPEVPSTTQVTITKVNTNEEQQRKSAIVQHGNVIVTSTTVTSPPSSGTTNHMARIVPSVHSIQHHSQQIPPQAELLRIGCIVNKEDPRQANFRTNDMYASTQPPRVEVSASVVMTASASPKGGRNSQQLEQSQPQIPQRNFASHHTITFDSPMAEVLSYTRQPADPSPYVTNQTNHPQSVYPGHFTPVSMPGSSAGNIVQVQPGIYGVRKGVSENIVQQQQKRGTPELHKGGATLTLITPDHSIPQPLHVPPHLTSPHPSDQRSSESPMVATVYNQRMYGTAVPAHHQPPRPTFPNPYAELEERPYGGSPSYHPFEQRVLERDREREIQRDSSPYPNVVSRRVVSPPPAHIRYSIHPSMSGEAPSPTGRPRPQIPADPHGDQAPSQGDSPLLMLLQRYPIMWQGLLALKNDSAACQMHFVSGNLNVARDSLPSPPDGTIPPLRISQRMRLEQTQLEGVARKMQMEPEYCMLLALPCGRDEIDVLQQSNNLRTGFITYLQLKQAAGIVNICHPVNQQPAYVIHIFPSCDFANEKLANIAPDLLNGVADIAHLLIIIATV